MDYKQSINEQIGEKLLVYNYDLNKKKGDHNLTYLSLLAIASLVIYVAVQVYRCVGK